MTENAIKQSLSFHYLGLIASYSGYRFDRPFTDYGVDAVLEKIERLSINGINRHVASGKTVDIQLKATTQLKIVQLKQIIKFDLEVKTYNDLVRRYLLKNQTEGYLIPLVLVVFILPEKDTDWLVFGQKTSTISGSAYWIYPNQDWIISENKSSVRIEIPIENKVDLNFCEEMFNLVY